MAQLKVTQIKSEIGGTRPQRDSLRSLGLSGSGRLSQAGQAWFADDPGRSPPGKRGGGGLTCHQPSQRNEDAAQEDAAQEDASQGAETPGRERR